jgi:hypothetical protein
MKENKFDVVWRKIHNYQKSSLNYGKGFKLIPL